MSKQPKPQHSGRTRGEILAVETNSELISNSGVQQTSENPVQCSQDGTSCLSCRSVGMCMGGVLTEIPCRGLYSYCDARTGTCTSERRRCKADEKPMNCPSKGFFPDPQSCRSFHVCEGDPEMSFKFACSSLQIYDHVEKKCGRPSLKNRCTSFSCFGKQGRYTAYPSDRSIYTLCSDALGTALFKCPDDNEFDEAKQKCVPSCTSEDNMADRDDETCKRYYRCVKNGRTFEAVPSSCPGQRVFDLNELKCVPKTASFQCSHPSSGLDQTTSSENNNKEDLIGQTEETFFRNSQLNKEFSEKKSADENKSMPIVKSISSKDHNNQATTPQENSLIPKTPNEKPIQESYASKMTEKSNVNAELSTLSDESQLSNPHLPSKIVLRETGVLFIQHNEMSTIKNEACTTSSSKVSTNSDTSKEMKIMTSQPAVDSNLKSSTETVTQSLKMTPAILHSENNFNTPIPLKGQTNKAIINQVETTSLHNELPTTTHISPTDHSIMITSSSSTTTQPSSTAAEADNMHIFKEPVKVKIHESLPTQAFHIETNQKVQKDEKS